LPQELAAQLRAAEGSGAIFVVNLKRFMPSERPQAASAHWSPLAGYAERQGGGEPYALLLDVAAPKIGSHW
jgi:hypothetical protein